jgi:hypothetical protein
MVASNARLVGAVFDDAQSALPPTWIAVLDIARDPVGVYDNYVRQARALGVPLPGSGASGTKCVRVYRGSATASTKCGTFGPPCNVSDGRLMCDGSATGGPRHPLGVSIQLLWGGNSRLLILHVSHTAAVNERPTLGTDRLTAIPHITAKPVEPIHEVGRPFGSMTNAFTRGYRRIRLEKGSIVIADAPDLRLAVLRLDADPKVVLLRYGTQLAQPGPAPAVRVVSIASRGTAWTLNYGPEGGGSAELTTDTTHVYAMLTYASD